MNFDSYHYLLFLIVVVGSYWFLPHKGQNWLLLAASYFFYGCWDWRFLSLIVISTIVDFVAGQAIHGSEDQRRRRLWLILSCVVNLGLLGFFKYYDFFAVECNSMLTGFGFSSHLRTLKIILPVGISFYTFQTMSYTIDVYRGVTKPVTNLRDFALYVSFFPQLVAGPIERSTHLAPQVTNPRKLDGNATFEGVYMIIWGLVKKVVIADNAAIIADLVFDAPLESLTGLECLVGVYAFAFQIYGDFSGYSLIARGTARLLGFDLMVNFNFPYFATAPRFFWHRWHISLSTWLRDYLYIPLGGSRKGRVRNYVNLMLTMILGGLWHGAAWRFVVWGALHGGMLAIDKKIFGEREKDDARSLVGGLCALITFHLVCISWIFFRANTFMHALGMLKTVFGSWGSAGQYGVSMSVYMVIYCLPFLAYEWLLYCKKDHFFVLKQPWFVRGLFFFILLAILIFMGAPLRHEFIYFQF